MRPATRILVLLLLAGAPAVPARAADAPDLPRPVPPPRPEAAGLLDRLLAQDGDVRAAAEATVAKASPEALRVLLLAMRDRTARAEAAVRSGPGTGSAPFGPAAPSERGVEHALRLLDVGEETAARLLGAPPDAGRPVHRLLAGREAAALLAAVAEEPDAKVLASPTTRTYDGQEATTESLESRSYVADFEVDRTGAAPVADPVVRTYAAGVRLTTKARILHDGRTLSASLALEVLDPVEPVAVETLPPVAGQATLEVQRPEILDRRWSRSFLVGAGQSVLVTFPPAFAGRAGRRPAILYTPSVVGLEGTEAAPAAPAQGPR